MKVVIKCDGKKFFLLLPTAFLPTAFLFNRLTATIVIQIINHKWPSLTLSTDDLLKLVQSVKECKRKNKHWVLIDLRTAEGDIVYLRL